MSQPKQNKLSTPHNPKYFVVEEKEGSMVTMRDLRLLQGIRYILKMLLNMSWMVKTNLEEKAFQIHLWYDQNRQNLREHSFEAFAKADQASRQILLLYASSLLEIAWSKPIHSAEMDF